MSNGRPTKSARGETAARQRADETPKNLLALIKRAQERETAAMREEARLRASIAAREERILRAGHPLPPSHPNNLLPVVKALAVGNLLVGGTMPLRVAVRTRPQRKTRVPAAWR